MQQEIIQTALLEYGYKERSGKNNHEERVLKYFEEIGHSWVEDDETAWCAAFANYILKKCGYKHSGELDARSLLNIGQPVDNPEMGDVVVLWRGKPDGWKGHCGFYIRSPYDYIWILGGNQQDQVTISPYDEGRLLGYRRPNKG